MVDAEKALLIEIITPTTDISHAIDFTVHQSHFSVWFNYELQKRLSGVMIDTFCQATRTQMCLKINVMYEMHEVFSLRYKNANNII